MVQDRTQPGAYPGAYPKHVVLILPVPLCFHICFLKLQCFSCLSSSYIQLVIRHENFLMAAFGWSVGDLVSAISVVAKVSKALKDVGGAGDDYRETVLFLESLNVTLNTLSGLYEAKVDPNILLGVQSQLKLVQKPVDIFTEKVKRKLGSALDGTQKATGFRARIKRASSKLEWAFWLNEQSQTLNKKILVPLIEIQIQLGIQIQSVFTPITQNTFV